MKKTETRITPKDEMRRYKPINKNTLAQTHFTDRQTEHILSKKPKSLYEGIKSH
jgi:hypothetical protein